ncbi:Uncharacterized protein APZ42_012860 [Daphnia magna]|uniref:Uncharacterized protein n=1 Tax=Daphnia magna TaxID=35525 RepID=A0A0P5BVI2_9CRUS|nr:Uncharacterized protein APZ42_012860 [Daphnia magna]
MTRWQLLLIATIAIYATDGQAKSAASSRSIASERIGRYKSLLTEHFALPRHPYLNEVNWIKARSAIVEEFQKILHNVPNVTMEIQDFQTEISFVPNISTDIKGQNIIVTFSGKNRRKATDEILVIGAHYDSEASPLISIDDNGSGVVAMLEVARGLADAIVNRKAILLNTIMFVAFDIQNEFSDGLGQTGGSDFFVKEKLATILDEQPKPGFLGAIVLDSVMNYNSSTGSQVLPSGFDKSFPEAFSQVQANMYKGNYLAMVTKERLRSLQLDYVIAQEWNKTDTQGQFPLIQLEIRRTAASPALFEFLKQDHVPFWNHNNNPLSAVLLTDTSKWRGIQRMCGLEVCNSTSLLTVDRLNMLDQVVVTLDRFISISHLNDSAAIETGSGTSTYASLSATFLTVLVAYLL